MPDNTNVANNNLPLTAQNAKVSAGDKSFATKKNSLSEVDLAEKSAKDKNIFNEPEKLEPSNRRRTQQIVTTILGIALLVAGVAAGVFLVNQKVKYSARAWDCVNYVFEVNESGTVLTRNGSTRNEPKQQAIVQINGQEVATLDVPPLKAGEAVEIGNVFFSGRIFDWKVVGTKDCKSESPR